MMYKNFYSKLLMSESSSISFDKLKEKRFKNPDTGNLIKIASALTYEPHTRPYKLAMKYLELYGFNASEVDTKVNGEKKTKDTTDLPTKSVKKPEEDAKISVSGLHFRYDANDNSFKVSVLEPAESPFVQFDGGDGVESVKLTVNGKESAQTKFTKGKFFPIGGKYDLIIVADDKTYDNIKDYLTKNVKLFSKKARLLAKNGDFDKKELIGTIRKFKEKISSLI